MEGGSGCGGSVARGCGEKGSTDSRGGAVGVVAVGGRADLCGIGVVIWAGVGVTGAGVGNGEAEGVAVGVAIGGGEQSGSVILHCASAAAGTMQLTATTIRKINLRIIPVY